MTSLAFILGVLPLVTAAAQDALAGSLWEHRVRCMILATLLNLFFIPALYVLVKGFRSQA